MNSPLFYATIAKEEVNALKILLLEDNESIAKGLAYSFEKNNYEFTYRTTVKETEAYLLKNDDLDLIILDIALPDGNGFDLYKNEIKPREIPTIFLTARDDEDDIVRGLDVGAEDYITKPFSTKELMARVNKILMRTKKQRVISIGDVSFDTDRLVLHNVKDRIDLTPLELKIVNLLFSNLHKVVTRSTLLDKIWEWTGNDVDDHTVTVYLNRIREKLGADIIVTVKGMGYRIDEQ